MADWYISSGGDDSTGSGTSASPYYSPGKVGSVWSAGDTLHVHYTGTPIVLTSATPNVAGGPLKITFTNETNPTRVFGFDTTDSVGNTDSNRPAIQVGAGLSSFVIIESSGYGNEVRNLILDGNSQTGITGVYNSGGYGTPVLNCEARNCQYGFRGNANIREDLFFYCRATGCSGAGFYNASVCVACGADSNSATGFLYDTGQEKANLNRCISANNSGATSDGFANSGVGDQIVATGCTSYGNGRDGFRLLSYSRASLLSDCVAATNGGYGFNAIADAVANLRNCAGYQNTSGNLNLVAATQSIGFVNLGAGPFANPTGSVNSLADLFANFLPNSTGGLRGAGFPAYGAIGAVQPQDSGGGGSGAPFIGIIGGW